MIHKTNSYRYYIELDVSEPGTQEFYKINYLPNGGLHTFTDKCEIGQHYTIKNYQGIRMMPNQLETLKEWNLNPDGTEGAFAPGDEIILDSNLTLYAI